MSIKFHTNKSELFPKRSTKNSAGYDFFAPEDIVIPAHGVSNLIDTGVSIELSQSLVLMCYVRSSLGIKYGITLCNGTGIIDSDFYPNTIKCRLKNEDNYDFVIHKGEKYMQGIIMNWYKADNEIIPDEERNGGIGSTGK